MQSNGNDNKNMNTFNSSVKIGATTGLNSAENLVKTNQQSVANQSAGQQSNDSKKTQKRLIVVCLVVLVLLIIGIIAVIVMMNSNDHGSSGSEQLDISDEVVEEDDKEEEDGDEEVEVGESMFEIEQTGTAEVEDGSFSIKDQDGAVIAEDDVMADVTGIKTCETVNDDVETSIRCAVTTEKGEGIYVYYVEDKVLKYADQ